MYKYVGKGSFVTGIPARDISEEEAKEYDINSLEKSGLWIHETSKSKPKSSSDKSSKGPKENK